MDQPEIIFNGVKLKDEDELTEALNAWQDEMVAYTKKVAEELGVSEYAAGLIVYLRGRSRWTQEKEEQLIALDKAGKKLPDVLSGEF